ncbi:hypothetical protein G3I59_31175 [Amycolatopsis rubida]|uniref:MmyB-like transcription regulator ligand binding domain-containing protein n=1 Tax=Amycolatopsis rubida TaxID=112413 RepID=A0ABX0BWE2_9PSEU|nr:MULTISPECIES: hypothetical protein [Amycolatopsis]MYW94942.1 hypothetical protein [Amycolatopsis rubida]NEC59929.1 hypothetical protein [Amycolatopsis rubida]OAP25666.1 hypothetical protein A4R44_03040 [Amycolatopsis sp. M39]
MKKAPQTYELPGGHSASSVIARHLYTRVELGRAIVIAANPAAIMAAISKQWKQLIRAVEREHAATLKADLRAVLADKQDQMQAVTFGLSYQRRTAAVLCLSPEELPAIPADTLTVYLLVELPEDRLQALPRHLPDGALTVKVGA